MFPQRLPGLLMGGGCLISCPWRSGGPALQRWGLAWTLASRDVGGCGDDALCGRADNCSQVQPIRRHRHRLRETFLILGPLNHREEAIWRVGIPDVMRDACYQLTHLEKNSNLQTLDSSWTAATCVAPEGLFPLCKVLPLPAAHSGPLTKAGLWLSRTELPANHACQRQVSDPGFCRSWTQDRIQSSIRKPL